MYQHETRIRVRYAETDQMGYVYYGNYPAYYEVGRVEAIRSLGITYRELEEKGIFMPVMSLNIRYLRPAYYDEELRILTTIRELPEQDIHFHVEILNAENKIINAGHVRLCFVSAETRKRIPVPEDITLRLKPYFEG